MKTYLSTVLAANAARRWGSLVVAGRRQGVRRYAYALALTLIALAVRLLIAPVDGGIQYVTFFPAVAISALIGGFWPGLFSALFGATLASYFFWPPYRTWVFDYGHAMLLSNVVFLIDAVIVSAAIDTMHRLYLNSVAEIQQRKAAVAALRESESRLQMANQAANIGTFDWNVQTGVTLWSRELERMYGLAPGEFGNTQSAWKRLIHPEDCEAATALVNRTLATGEQVEGEWRVVWPDGSTHWLAGRFQAIKAPDGRPLRLVGVNIDITPRRRAEEEIRVLMATLEQRVAERTAALQAANQELESFTFAVSHDIKGPLSRINSFSALLARDYRERLEGSGTLALDFIQANAARLSRLVDDLLSRALISHQALSLQPVNVRALVESIIVERAHEIQASGAEVSIHHLSARVRADPILLHQVLTNLVENALKYSAHAQSPRVELGSEAIEDGCRLWIRDNGIGFDMQDHDRIFDLFHRLHAYSEIPGTGVGLALVKRAMERMDGKVWAEGASGQGATFFLELPLAESTLPDDCVSVSA